MWKAYLSAAALLTSAGLINVIRPQRTNMPVDPADVVEAQLRIPLNVATILGRACQDCHTERTQWPWYSNIAPFGWLMAADVYGARSHMNLSAWGRYKEDEKTERLIGMCEMVAAGKMPPPSYRVMHTAAWLSASDKRAVCDWAKSEVAHSTARGSTTP